MGYASGHCHPEEMEKKAIDSLDSVDFLDNNSKLVKPRQVDLRQLVAAAEVGHDLIDVVLE